MKRTVWNLPFARDLIKCGYRVFDEKTGKEETTADEEFALLLSAMRNNPAIGHIIPGAVAAFASASNETLANLKSSLFTQTRWLDNPSIRAVLLTSSFDIRDLKRRDDVVFSFVAGIFALKGSLAPLARFVISITALAFEHFDKMRRQCLMVVDELPSIGNIKTIEVVLPVLRSYGVVFIGISQDIQLFQSAYPQNWRSFIGNADYVICLASNEEETKAYCSKALGKTTIVRKDKYSGRKIREIVDVLSPEQIGRLLEPESGRMIVMRADKRASVLVNDPYFTALPVQCYEPDPDHKEAALRRISRFFFDRKVNKPQAPVIHDHEESTYEESATNVIPFKKTMR